MLHRIPFLALAFSTVVASSPAQLPTSCEKVVDYEIDVTLDDDGRTIFGTLNLEWTNRTKHSTSQLVWHVYNNAWSNKNSVFMREAHLFGDDRMPLDWAASTEISAARIYPDDASAARNLTINWRRQPDAPEDRTVMELPLPKPVEPGQSVKVSLDFTTVMPPAYRRSGGDNDRGYIHAVQWFPKVGVFELKDGQAFWNCEPYHYLTEFYADYGTWELRLTCPKRYADKVAASGTRSTKVETNSDTVTYTFNATDIHDFAWTADPDFDVHSVSFHQLLEENNWRDRELEQQLADALIGEPGFEHIKSVADLFPRDVEMILMLQPEHSEYADAYLEATAKSLYYFGIQYGEYPYATISIIDPAHNARQTGGMEYPRLFTGGTRKGRAARTLSPEGITIHEFGHQFWYGLVGNDEFNHAWLDEGFNTFSTQRVKAMGWEKSLATYNVLGSEYYGQAPVSMPSYGKGNALSLLSMQRLETPDLGFMPPISQELRRDTSLIKWARELPPLSYYPEVEQDAVLSLRGAFNSDWSDPLATPTFKLLNGQMRRVNAYSRPALTLETFARLMGPVAWTRVIRGYHEKHRFGHPQPLDLLAMIEKYAGGIKVAGHVLNWKSIWNHAYQQNDVLDYGIHRLSCKTALENENNFDVTLELRRLGEFKLPVEILVTWDDDSTSELSWNGQSQWWRKSWPNSSNQIKSVVVDPQRRLLLDRDWMNNSQLLEADEKRAYRLGLRALLWAQQVLHYAGGMG